MIQNSDDNNDEDDENIHVMKLLQIYLNKKNLNNFYYIFQLLIQKTNKKILQIFSNLDNKMKFYNDTEEKLKELK